MNNHLSKLNETSGPRHVAIIMDGNGRWATNRGLPRIAGHKVGIEKIQQVLQCLSDNHVTFVTLYAFSTENWNRPLPEVRGILNLMEEALTKQTTVTEIGRESGIIKITLQDARKGAQGAVTLVLSSPPLMLRQWLVTDAQGLTTKVSIFETETNIPIEAKIFTFTDPPPGRR